eukprot:12389275-Karenia_brevis.AAC.1
MKQIITDQQLELDIVETAQSSSLELKQPCHATPLHFDATLISTSPSAGHPSPVLFDIFDDASPVHFDATCHAAADHASPLLFDVASQTATAAHASPVLFDASAQIQISILKTWPNKFYTIYEDGHA